MTGVEYIPSGFAETEMQAFAAIPINFGHQLSYLSPQVTADYPSPGSKKLDEDGLPTAFQYPGRRPITSFSVLGDQVALGGTIQPTDFYINTHSEAGDDLVFDIDDILSRAGVATMDERVPVIAFGSNANPGQLAQKFNKLEGADKDIVPTLAAVVKGVVPVYVARIGINGYVFTDLVPAPDPDTECEVFVNCLSTEQLKAMDATEKAYSLCKISDVRLGAPDQIDTNTCAYLYVGKDGEGGADILIDEDERPIRLSEIRTDGKKLEKNFSSMTQSQVQQYIYKIAGRAIARALLLDETPRDHIEMIKLIIDRRDNPRFDKLRETSDEPLGRVIGRANQKAIADTGRTTKSTNIRTRIPKDQQDIGINEAKSLKELVATS